MRFLLVPVRDLDILMPCCGQSDACTSVRWFPNVGNASTPDFTGNYTLVYDASGYEIQSTVLSLYDFDGDGTWHVLSSTPQVPARRSFEGLFPMHR